MKKTTLKRVGENYTKNEWRKLKTSEWSVIRFHPCLSLHNFRPNTTKELSNLLSTTYKQIFIDENQYHNSEDFEFDDLFYVETTLETSEDKTTLETSVDKSTLETSVVDGELDAPAGSIVYIRSSTWNYEKSRLVYANVEGTFKEGANSTLVLSVYLLHSFWV